MPLARCLGRAQWSFLELPRDGRAVFTISPSGQLELLPTDAHASNFRGEHMPAKEEGKALTTGLINLGVICPGEQLSLHFESEFEDQSRSLNSV